jgi:glutamine amidotransferase
MCRLFGFRSIMKSQVHTSLVSADNALMTQSEHNPDGWGVAYYVDGAPHVLKSVNTAIDDHIFPRVSGVVTSETVLAHVRKATQGNHTILNTHPFQFGHWVFVHNGNIRGFAAIKDQLLAQIPPVLRRFILGDTDSELLFYLLISKMAQREELDRPGYPLRALADAVSETIELVCEIAGDICEDDGADPGNNFLTFVITNGCTMLAHQGGKLLYVSTHKKRCSERDQCPHYRHECEAELPSAFVSHFIISSEPLQGENVWQAMRPRQMIAVDWRMQLNRFAS